MRCCIQDLKLGWTLTRTYSDKLGDAEFNVEGLRRYPHTTSDCPRSQQICKNWTFWIYSDASEIDIAAVSYLKAFFPDGSTSTGFLLGKSKVAPVSGHTIPRFELCAAVLAFEVSQIVIEHMNMSFDLVKYFTDSRVVLGYIHNERDDLLFMLQTELRGFKASASHLCQPTSILLMKVPEEYFQRTLQIVHGRREQRICFEKMKKTQLKYFLYKNQMKTKSSDLYVWRQNVNCC